MWENFNLCHIVTFRIISAFCCIPVCSEEVQGNGTDSGIRYISQVQGFSREHQVNICAWVLKTNYYYPYKKEETMWKMVDANGYKEIKWMVGASKIYY